MRVPVCLSFMLAILTASWADYTVQSDFLKDPLLGAAHVKKLADFWKQYRDSTNGGYYNVVGLTGIASKVSYKYFSPQSRLGWVFARAFMVTGDTTYLNHSDHALKLLYEKAWTPGTGGWYYACSPDCSLPRDYSLGKWSYMQHYALLGIGAALEAQGGQHFPLDATHPDHWSNWRKGLEWNNEYLWDTTASQLGYFTNSGSKPHAGTGKGFTPTVDAITTHADLASLLSGDPADLERFTLLGDAMSDRMVAAMDSTGVLVGFPEEYLANWHIYTAMPSAMVGHMVKTSWCLGRVWLQNPKPKYLTAMAKVLEDMWASGAVDTVMGGTSSSFAWNQHPPVARSEKSYWMTEQAINAGLMNWYLQSDPLLRDRSLRMADRSADFFSKHFVHSDGGTIMSTDWNGVPVDGNLGDEWDAGYHSAEVGWQTYLYGNLFLKGQPISLYYRLAPSREAQEIKLNPIRLKDDGLAILSVQKDGAAYVDFSSADRTLRLPAGVGGIFKVVFGRAASVALSPHASSPSLDLHWDLATCNLTFHLPQAGQVRIRLLSLDGRLLQTWYDGKLDAGARSLVVPAGHIAQGLHFLTLEGEGIHQSLRILM